VAVTELVHLAREALLLALLVSLPVVAAAALVGLITSLLQAAAQIQDFTLSHLPRLIAVTVVLALLGPWMGAQVAGFAARVFVGG
jgi:type III secretion HrpO family protein